MEKRKQRLVEDIRELERLIGTLPPGSPAEPDRRALRMYHQMLERKQELLAELELEPDLKSA